MKSEERTYDNLQRFSLLGGLALFLFGMDIMGKALESRRAASCKRS